MLNPARAGTGAIGAVLLAAVLAWPCAARSASCRSEAGERTAGRYVEDCLAVSAATHPPCNVENSCALILGEIERSCAQIADGEEGSRVCRRCR